MTAAPVEAKEQAFHVLTAADIEEIAKLAKPEAYRDGDYVFRAGDAELDLFVVLSGQIDIHNPTDNNKLIVSHMPGQFAGDIDLITRRPVIVNAISRGAKIELLRVPGDQIPHVLNRIPRLGEKMISAFTARRALLQQGGVLG